MPQRSPVIFWLLLAATLGVDVVAIVGLFDDMNQPTAATLFIALAYAQVSLLCAWVMLSRPAIGFRWLIPFGAGLVIAMLIVAAGIHQRTGQPFRWELLLAFASLMWVHVAVLLLLLWLLKPTRLFASDPARSDQPSWQFTMKHLFLVMTCLPILVIALQNSAIVRSGVTIRGVLEFVSWVIGSVLLPLAIVAIVSRNRMWILQLALCAGAALAIGLFLLWAVPEMSRTFRPLAFAIIQAFVMWLWLEPFRPLRSADAVADIQPPTPQM